MTRLLALALLVLVAGAGAARATVASRTSLPEVESEVMCVTCKIPLNLAQSVQADRERAFIRRLVAEGRTKQQVLDAMVAQYGPRVLATPGTSGIDLTAWLVPGGAVALLLGAGVLALPRWRRRARAARATPEASGGAPLAAADARRLEEELARYDARAAG